MLHYKLQVMSRSLDGADREHKCDVELMPDSGQLQLDLNALRNGQFYRVSLIDFDGVGNQPDPITETDFDKTKGEPPHID